MALRIRDWDGLFENSTSRKLKRLDWVAIPNKTDGSGYMELVDHPDGAAHFGAWCAIVQCASKQKVRGNLPGISQDVGKISQNVGKISQLPGGLFERVIPRLLKIGWLEEYEPNQSDTESPTLLGENPMTSGENPSMLGKSPRHTEGKGTTGKGTTTAAAPPPLASVSEFPLSREELRKRDPAVDDIFVRRLAQETAQYLISMDDMDEWDDEDLARAIRESYDTYRGKHEHGNGLLLSRVPRIIHNWGQNGKTA